jgi:RHS repeat-associated protein
MHALASRTSAHAHPRVSVRKRTADQARSRANGCKTASRKKFFFSRFNSRVRCAQASTVPRETALFLGASMSGAIVLRFPGQYFDSESGQFHNYYRNYIPSLARYGQNDPIGLGGGPNRIIYAEGDAVNGFDPYGLAACQVLFPNMPIDTGLGFSSTNLGGHGGILTFDNRGGTQYHEYGRYPSSQATGVGLPAEEGNVRQVRVPNLKLDKNGQPTPESLEALKKVLQDKSGKGTNAELTCDADADEKKIRDYIKKIAEDANRAKYSWKPWSSNQCRDFANRAFNSGR